jgi:outer membrane lipoprotein SlyB
MPHIGCAPGRTEYIDCNRIRLGDPIMPIAEHRRLRRTLTDASLRTTIFIATLALGACARSPESTPAASTAEPAPVAESAPAVEAAPVAVAAPAPEPVVAPAAAKPQPVRATPKPAPRPVSTPAASQPPVVAAAPAPLCTNCGVITDIKIVKVAGKATGLGAVAGGVTGIVVGNQIGDGDGKTIAKIAGAAGGAYLGNRIEKRVRSQDTYEVTVRLEDGSLQTVTQSTDPGLAIGAAVRVVDSTVIAR